MSLTDIRELSGRIVVKTDRGIGCRTGVDEEVVFIGVGFFGDGLVESNDSSEPLCYDKSRETLLQWAKELRDGGHLDEFGLHGPAVKYVIPGIPFPKGPDKKGNQKHDIGGHLTLWCRPGYAANGAAYTPPDLTKARQINGQEVKFTLLPPSEGIKILVGSENNDMETGICYYICLVCDDNSTKIANSVKVSVGLEADNTQQFHFTLAGAAPAWQEVHPKFLAYRNATEEHKKHMNLEEDFQVFRKGVGNFVGFNADAVTGWSTHAARSVEIGQENAHISKSLAEYNEKIAELNRKRKMLSEELGYPKSISNSNAKKLKSALPSITSQEQIMATFAPKRYG